MNRRNLARLARLAYTGISLTVGALAGCGAPSEGPAGETASAASLAPEALVLPPLPGSEWQPGFSAYGIRAGTDVDGTALYPCRATLPLNGLLTPGKTRADWNTCAVSYGGKVYWEAAYETLATEWIPEEKGVVPPNAFVAAPATPVKASITPSLAPPAASYVCRATYGGIENVGRVGGGLAGCAIAASAGGAQEVVPSYQVLAVPTATFSLSPALVFPGDAPPWNAIRGGTDTKGAAIYPCVVPYEGTLVIGRTEIGWGSCAILTGGHELRAPGSYNVFIPYFAAPTGPYFVAGSDTGGQPLGVCSAYTYQGGASSTQVGKYIPASGLCDFPYGESEIAESKGFDVFEVGSTGQGLSAN